VISTLVSPLPARIGIALSEAGFRVAMLLPPENVARKVNAIGAFYTYKRSARRSSIISAINAYFPDLLVCTDDDAISDLHRLHLEASREIVDERAIRLVSLIEASLGNPANFAIVRAKSRLIAFAQAAGVRCPRTVIAPHGKMLERDYWNIAYPIMVKADGTYGGVGVRIAHDWQSARTAYQDLAMPNGWSRAFIQALIELTPQPLLDRASGRRRVVTFQEHVKGRPANRAIVCVKGEVIAGLSVEVHETTSPMGYSTVVKIIDHPEMRETAEILARRLELTGFHGFDFILDSANGAWLLELNSRVTPIAHLTVKNFSLAAALFSYLTGTERAAPAPPDMDKVIALFPQEWLRCPGGKYLSSCYQDVPWGEPEFVTACLSQDLENTLAQRIRRRLGLKRRGRLARPAQSI
jgi:glutathione synthase/RimK-type ligase-like ATP-grasp enzyme